MYNSLDELVDKIEEYYIKENHAPGYDMEEGRCVMYNEVTGDRCALGIFVPDDMLHTINQYNLVDVFYLLQDRNIFGAGIYLIHINFIVSMHDHIAHNSKQFRDNLILAIQEYRSNDGNYHVDIK